MNTATTTESHPVAHTILAQLGGRSFIAMTGANAFMADQKALTFKVGKNAKSVSHVRITLELTDTYKVEAIRVRRVKGILISKVLETLEDVYAEDLRRIFTDLTGLYTKL